MQIKKIFIFMMIMLVSPFIVNAETDDEDIKDYTVASINEKYFKTTYILNKPNSSMYSSNLEKNDVIFSYTKEVTKDEYDNYNEDDVNQLFGSSNSVQTEYKKLTVSILENGVGYIYQAVLDWKNMPATRSYDIMGIGFYQSVYANSISYNTYYCISGESCYTSYAYTSRTFATGAGVAFALPTGNLSTLRNTLKIYMSKNVDSTIVSQKAVADYSHATKSIADNLAKNNYTVNTGGITLNGIDSYYDDMPAVTTILNCNW